MTKTMTADDLESMKRNNAPVGFVYSMKSGDRIIKVYGFLMAQAVIKWFFDQSQKESADKVHGMSSFLTTGDPPSGPADLVILTSEIAGVWIEYDYVERTTRDEANRRKYYDSITEQGKTMRSMRGDEDWKAGGE